MCQFIHLGNLYRRQKSGATADTELGSELGRSHGKSDTYGHGIHIEDEKMQRHGETDGSQKPDVYPGRHPDQGLVL